MKIERKKQVTESVVDVSADSANVHLRVTGGGQSVTVALTLKEARKLSKALRDAAIVSAEHSESRFYVDDDIF